MNKLDRLVTHMRKLIDLNAPACIKADCLVNLLLPQMAVEIGVADVTAALAKFMGQGIARYKGVCWICLKREITRGDDICARCQAETDQLAAAFDDRPDDGPGTDDGE